MRFAPLRVIGEPMTSPEILAWFLRRHPGRGGVDLPELIEASRAAEREVCARIVEEHVGPGCGAALLIRARDPR